ncbi:hypothetical protein S40293_01125 [Stachybotrys chartarum IBT 40293]|nr:hypothetical protein S40293_01125 [Stachybotrys chartarum IBT 40293]KFA72671.1 hypothetical protein S40288_03399 [Stachybotrys chartarum IBT 40288]
MLYRIVVFLLGLFFPPLSVYLLCGAGMDLLVNCIFFLLAVIPANIHGMYISSTYFHRQGKVRNGRLPGKQRGGIYSKNVQNGGASKRELEAIVTMQGARPAASNNEAL